MFCSSSLLSPVELLWLAIACIPNLLGLLVRCDPIHSERVPEMALKSQSVRFRQSIIKAARSLAKVVLSSSVVGFFSSEYLEAK